MTRDPILELRILSGVHAGAREVLPQGAWLLGHADHADLIVCDAGIAAEHARLEVRDDGSLAVAWLDGTGSHAIVPAGHRVSLGPVEIALVPQDSPWLTDLPWAPDLPPPPAAPAGGTALSAAPAEAPTAADAPAPQASPPPAPARPPRTATKVGVVAGALLVAAVLAWRPWATEPTPPPLPIPAPLARAPGMGPADLAAVRAVVRDLGLEPVARAVADAHGGVTVHAGLLSEDEAESLAVHLARLSPRPGLRFAQADEIVAEASAFLQERLGESGRLEIRHLGQGRFALQGVLPDDATQQALVAALQQRVAHVRSVDTRAVQTREQQGRALVDTLRRAGFGAIESRWDTQQLQLKVRLASADVPRWERSLAAAVRQHAVPLQATLELTDPRPVAAPAARLPLQIASIVSGEVPYVVLSDGTKLLTDGAHAGWTLVRVDAEAVVFEGPRKQRVAVAR